ncbi:MAG: carbohydrate ABC transporter permease [Clostridia bacterium]|nr:carbohydrate ABC transporter permease [Clostridia bacterium]
MMARKTVINAVGLLCLLPFVLMLSGSLKGSPVLSQYGMALLQSPEFIRGFWNSIIYTVLILAVNLPVSLLTAYGLTRFALWGRRGILWLYIILMLMPFQATMVSQYLALKAMGLLNTPWAVILPNAFSTFGAFLMTQYMRGFDHSLYDAAQIDGMSEWSMFCRLVTPVCKPIITALGVLSFVNYWSTVEQPSLFLDNATLMPLAVRLNGRMTFSGFAFACGVLFSVLPLLLYIYSYNDLQGGIGLTAGTGTQALPKEGQKRQSWAVKAAAGFLTIMLACTLITGKVSYMMTPQVSVWTLERKAPVLSEYKCVVPQECVRGSRAFAVMPYAYDRSLWQIIALDVRVEQMQDGFAAITGAIPSQAVFVCQSDRAIAPGDVVRIAAEAYK